MNRKLSMAAAIIAMLPAAPAAAQEYKIGISAGLTGYAATVDRAWSDAVQLAAEAVNSRGGVMGRKLQVIVEDNRSEPQEAVTVYRKMISSDQRTCLHRAACRPAISRPPGSSSGLRSRWCCARSCRSSRIT